MISQFKRIMSLCLAFVLVAGMILIAPEATSAAEYITTPEDLNGADYTISDVMAKKLNEIFAGDIDIFTDSKFTNEKQLPVGSRVPGSTQYYIFSTLHNSYASGWQCFIYANAVYNKLFGEWIRRGEGLKKSQVIISGGSKTISYEMFRDAGVRCGAYMRTTSNSDGSYNGGAGHSMIVLAYGKENITFLEGNADGNGLVRVTIRTWSDFNDRLLGGRGRYLNHVAQPTEEYYNSLYPGCAHSGYNAVGVCGSCGYVYDWEATGDPWAMGTYKVTTKVKTSVGSPYAAAASGVILNVGTKIQIQAMYTNAFGQAWYAYEDASGKVYYVPGETVSFVEHLPFEGECTGFSPPDQSVLLPQSYPVKGIVTTNYPMKYLVAYLDGVEYARWTAPDTVTKQIDLRTTDVNKKLTFSALAAGNHTITIKAASWLHSGEHLILESSFSMNRDCSHNYSSKVTTEATCTTDGLRTYTCDYCGDSYTRTIAAYGHNFQNGSCTHCGAKVTATLSGTIVSGGKGSDAVTITLRNNTNHYTISTKDDEYALSNIALGSYTIEYSKNGCVTGTDLITLSSQTATYNIKLCPKGDVTGDMSVNMGDVARLYAHTRDIKHLTDAYAICCADFTEDGRVNMGDVAKLYTKTRGKL